MDSIEMLCWASRLVMAAVRDATELPLRRVPIRPEHIALFEPADALRPGDWR